MIKKMGLGLTLLALLAGCSSVPTAENASPKHKGYTAVTGGMSEGETYYLIKRNGQWQAARDGNINNENVERVVVDTQNKQVDLRLTNLYYSVVDSSKIRDTAGCDRGAESQKRTGKTLIWRETFNENYSLCTTAFTKLNNNVGALIIAPFINIFTIPFTASVKVPVQFDGEALLNAVFSSGLIEMAEKDRADAIAAAEKARQEAEAARLKAEQEAEKARLKVEQERLAADQAAEQGNAEAKYQRGMAYFGSDRSSAENWFNKAAKGGSAEALYMLGTFESDSEQAERLWIKAAQGGSARAQAEIQRITEERKRAAQAARERAQAEKEAAARLAREQQQVAVFRRSVQEGVESNCGPIVEVKANLVKIAVAVANYGNEHWVRRDELFPAGYACRFYNGTYQPPQYLNH